MNKEDIKKALEYCTRSEGIEGCEKCPYSSIYGCNDTLCKDTLNLITEQEKEIEQLKEQIEELRNEKWGAQDDLDCYYDEMPSKIKQAKIDVLNELRNRLVVYYPSVISEIDELIKEIEE